MSRGRSFAIGLFAGGMVGWVLGILSAPHSGKETLEALGDRAIELRSKAEETAEMARMKAEGKTLEQIADKFGIKLSTVWARIKRMEEERHD